MPRHRAPTSQSRALSTVAVTGAALGASVLSPAVAFAATAHGVHSEAGHTLHTAAHHHRHYRPMTSGEEQYRNGCRQGYISDQCEQFSVPSLLDHGIDPYL
ncbi:MAG: hypothetical protein QOC67_3060 [Pseudonocardiales bacterium]|jgi:hypothetical protein|uniref:hypothetical protein n=1 Tax=Pseudonocardia sp. Cha107L01 TaxID=3457576 RepID=UPI0028CA45C1|nr:hypothetical protein [Pseudonocardiales bacterium]MDT7665217.1 hypothetical protein [Pseudonocardiales bacterium]MDT7667662.1 hypothetical protein [Pseudonocardiales bacterium]MDT7673959.1 hypothetical protein [Pseudonocardiales bacterium]MDT7683340.1 hypothetical protein [Pseudonocardiales bacterium]